MTVYKRKAIDLVDDIVRNRSFNAVNKTNKYETILREYINNYNKHEIKQIVSGNDIDLFNSLSDMPDLETRFDKMRSILGITVIDVSAYVCTIFTANDYNFAYVYSIIEDDKPMPIFISVGSNMISCDGEWRPLLMDICSYNLLLSKYSETIDSFISDIKNVKINTQTFFSNSLEKMFSEYFSVSKYSDTLLALAIFSGHFIYKSGRQQFHISEKFNELLKLSKRDLSNHKDAKKIYEYIGEVYNIEDPNAKSVGIGQKLISLTPDELSHPLNTSLKTWNEYNVSKLVTDLVLNCISPSFPIFGNWFFVFDTTKSLFNSDESKTKIDISDKIISSEKVEDDEFVLSNVAICMFMERIGMTLGNQLDKLTKKHLFDIFYAIHSLNVKLGYVHGDLHANNATIMVASTADKHDDVCYKIDGKTYVFPHDGKYGCLIDFSRSMPIEQEVVYIDYVIKKYEIHFPAFMELNYDTIMKLMSDAVDSLRLQIYISKTTMVFDVLELTTSLLNSKHDAKLGEDIRDFLVQIKKECEVILLNLLNHEKNDELEYPCKLLITKFFSEYEKPIPKKISAMYNFDNDLRYSIKSFDTLPKSMTVSPIIRDANDKPIDVNTYVTNMIKVRYHIAKIDEALLIGL